MWYKLFCFLCLLALGSSCSKEKLDNNSLQGKWTASSMRYVRLVDDTSVKNETLLENLSLDITNTAQEENRGGTVYGDYASGRARMPFVYNATFGNLPDKPNIAEGKILFSKTIKQKPAVSYRDKYDGFIAFQPDNINEPVIYPTRMTLINDKTLTMRIRLTPENYPDDPRNEVGLYITFTR